MATIVNNNIHIVGIGTSIITATQTGNATYLSATPVNQTLTVTGVAQTISFPAIPNKSSTDADFNPGATASSGLAVVYTSSNAAVATIVNNNIHIVGYGTSIITATQTGNSIYVAATSVIQTLTVTGKTQTISFAAIPAKAFGDLDFSPNAISTSGLVISYVSSNLAVATIVNNNIHIVGAGTAVITASQTGNAIYYSANSVSQTLTVTKAYTYVASSATILSGSLSSGAFGNLASNDSSYYVVKSTTTGTRVLDWYGSVTITQAPSTVSNLIVNYDGKNSVSKTQILYLYNFLTAAWDQIDSRTVSTTDVKVTYTQNSPANYISSTGQIRLRVYSSGSLTSFKCSGDWMQFQVQSTSATKGVFDISTNQNTEKELLLFPNPTSHLTTLKYSLHQDSKVSISVYDMNGRIIKTVLNDAMEMLGEKTNQFDVSGMPRGIYFVKTKINNKISITKLVVN